MRIRARGDEADEIVVNLTPMIDCVLNILFFYMLTTTFLEEEKELDLALPEAAAGHAPDAPVQEVVINVMADGRVKVNEQYLEPDALLDHLKRVAQADAETPVTIRGDRGTMYENAVRAMAACGQANLHRINVALLEPGR